MHRVRRAEAGVKLVVALICLTLVAPGLTQRGFRQEQRCYSPENEIGQCLALSNCPLIANVLNEYPRNVAIQYLRAAQRSCGNANFRGDPVVCCKLNQQLIASTTNRNPFFPTNPTTGGVFVEPTTRAPRPAPTTPAPRPVVQTTRAPEPTTSAPQTTSGVSISERAGDVCRGPDLLWGYCTPLAQCTPLATRLRNSPQDTTFYSFLRISNEICKKEYAVVCCPAADQAPFKQTVVLPKNTDEIPRKLLTVNDGCGYVDNSFRKIVGGTASKVGAWPWIALIGYNDGIQTSFKCGGALITARHVLTAAHCIVRGLSSVRLGEHDLSTDSETTHVDVPVVKILKHPQFTPVDGHNDIALLYLDRNVQFTAKITPICLPITPQLRTASFVSRTPFVAGWGKTMEKGQSAQVLQELQIPVYNNTVCRDLYQKQKRLVSETQFDDAIICAGELGGGKDTCQGDSGGPLMTPEPFNGSSRFFMIGVVSYGIGCARADAPGVYARVSTFIDWIEQSVANTP